MNRFNTPQGPIGIALALVLLAGVFLLAPIAQANEPGYQDDGTGQIEVVRGGSGGSRNSGPSDRGGDDGSGGWEADPDSFQVDAGEATMIETRKPKVPARGAFQRLLQWFAERYNGFWFGR